MHRGDHERSRKRLFLASPLVLAIGSTASFTNTWARPGYRTKVESCTFSSKRMEAVHSGPTSLDSLQ